MEKQFSLDKIWRAQVLQIDNFAPWRRSKCWGRSNSHKGSILIHQRSWLVYLILFRWWTYLVIWLVGTYSLDNFGSLLTKLTQIRLVSWTQIFFYKTFEINKAFSPSADSGVGNLFIQCSSFIFWTFAAFFPPAPSLFYWFSNFCSLKKFCLNLWLCFGINFHFWFNVVIS